jgi:transcriptional regulator with XRE-family HTH domain
MKTTVNCAPRHLDLRDRLREELARRRRVNARYSLRAFGEFLAIDHSTLSQILRGRRPLPPGFMRTCATRLNIGAEETLIYAAAATEDLAQLEAGVQRMHWIGEATALMSNPAHWQLLQLLRSPEWRSDMRWAAERIGNGIDAVNDALSRLLRLGLLRIERDGTWRDATGLDEPTEQRVKECGLERIRLAMSAS